MELDTRTAQREKGIINNERILRHFATGALQTLCSFTNRSHHLSPTCTQAYVWWSWMWQELKSEVNHVTSSLLLRVDRSSIQFSRPEEVSLCYLSYHEYWSRGNWWQLSSVQRNDHASVNVNEVWAKRLWTKPSPWLYYCTHSWPCQNNSCQLRQSPGFAVWFKACRMHQEFLA